MSEEIEYCYMMTASEATQNFRKLVCEFYDPDGENGNVYFSRQSRVPSHPNPLILITPGNVKRDRCATPHDFGGITVASRWSSILFTLDLFTDGEKITDEDTGAVLEHEDTAVNDLLNFLDFLDSDKCLALLNKLNAAANIESDVQNMTGIVRDSNYRYRARADVRFYFTDPMIGASGIAAMSSIVWPTEDGKAPEPTESVSAGKTDAEKAEDKAAVEPKYEADSSEGGSEELVKVETGYFTEVELTEETEDE